MGDISFYFIIDLDNCLNIKLTILRCSMQCLCFVVFCFDGTGKRWWTVMITKVSKRYNKETTDNIYGLSQDHRILPK